jgi:hypothetical protein
MTERFSSSDQDENFQESEEKNKEENEKANRPKPGHHAKNRKKTRGGNGWFHKGGRR